MIKLIFVSIFHLLLYRLQNDVVHANQKPAESLGVWEVGCNESDVNYFNHSY